MAKSVSVQINIIGMGDGESTSETVTLSSASSPMSAQNIVLAIGANTVTPPANTTMILLLSQAGSSILTLKGIAGDTGAVIKPGTLLFTAGAAFVLNSSTIETLRVLFL